MPGRFTSERITQFHVTMCSLPVCGICVIVVLYMMNNKALLQFSCNKIDIEREMQVAISNIESRFDKMCTEQQAHTSHSVHTFCNILLLHNKLLCFKYNFLVKFKFCYLSLGTAGL